eukprot:TRINITY_DN51183_c0_g2_i1.p1 TRINITY_DN51183_c0_g2~~TRINITY_DN51183_c0_g2_i1.p1  ORF type:complete len:798 (-),score=74.75 TRINITY_DN51183_c0_g2_i1:96-2489(-)
MHLFPREAKQKAYASQGLTYPPVPPRSPVAASPPREKLPDIPSQPRVSQNIWRRNPRAKKKGIGKKERTTAAPDILDTCAPYTESFNHILKNTARRDRETAARVVARMKERGVPMDVYTYNLLLDILVDTGDDSPFRVYEDMKEEAARDEPTVVPGLTTYHILIRACERSGAYDKAFQLFHEMKADYGIVPDVQLYNTLIGFCAAVRDERMAHEVFKEMNDKDLKPNVHTYNSLMNVFSDSPFEVVHNLFEDMLEKEIKPNLRSYNTLMKACQRVNDYDKAFRFFEELKGANIQPNVVTYNVLIQMLINRLDSPWRHLRGMKRNKKQPITVKEHAIRAIAETALGLFNEMVDQGCSPNTATYNAVMTVLARAGDHRVFDMFARMLEHSKLSQKKADEAAHKAEEEEMAKQNHNGSPEGGNRLRESGESLRTLLDPGTKDSDIVRPDLQTYTTLIAASEKMGLFDKAMDVFSIMNDVGIKPDKLTYVKMMDVCAIQRDVTRAQELFSEAKSFNIPPDVDLYNALLNVQAVAADETIFKTFQDMQELTIKPNQLTFNTLMKACETIKNPEKAFELYEEMLSPQCHVKPDTTTYNTLMDVCCIKQDTPRAADLLMDMKNTGVPISVTTYNRIMNVFAQANHDGIVDLFKAISKDGPRPNLESHTILLSYYCKKMDPGILTVFDDMKQQGVEPDLQAYNIMLQYCAAMRDKRKSLKFFEELKIRGLDADVDTYNALMSVFAESGDELIFKVFEEMNDNKIKPNHVTFSTLIKYKKGMEKLRTAAERKLLWPQLAALLEGQF